MLHLAGWLLGAFAWVMQVGHADGILEAIKNAK